MRRLSFILVLVLLVGGLPLWNAQASSPQPTVQSSVLLADTAAPSPGFFSGLISAIGKIVDWLFSAEKPDQKDAARTTAVTSKRSPSDVAKSKSVIPVKPLTPGGATSPKAALNAVTPSAVPLVAPSGLDDEASLDGGPNSGGDATVPPTAAAKSSVNDLLKLQGVKTPAVKSEVKTDKGTSTKTAKAVTPSKTTTPPTAAKSATSSDALGLSKVATPSAQGATSSATTPAQTPPIASQPAAAVPQVPATSASTERSSADSRTGSSTESRAAAAPASQPMLYAQPFTAPVASRPAVTETRPVTVETPVSRPRPIEETPVVRTPVETRPEVREPVVAVPPFIDAYIPRPVTVVERPTVEPVQETRPPPPAEETPVIVETRPPETRVETAPEAVPELRKTFILSDRTQQVVIQEASQDGVTTTTIIGPAVAVMCRNESLLSLGEDNNGITRGVVLSDGTILINPVDDLAKYLRVEGVSFVDALPRDCSLNASLKRLSMPDFIINMSRGLVSAKTVVGTDGRVLIVAADNTPEKTLRGIVVNYVGSNATDSRTSLTMFPERNQLPLTIRGVTVDGDLPGRIVVELVLSDRDGVTTTQRCEFAKDTDMTCTTVGAL